MSFIGEVRDAYITRATEELIANGCPPDHAPTAAAANYIGFVEGIRAGLVIGFLTGLALTTLAWWLMR